MSASGPGRGTPGRLIRARRLCAFDRGDSTVIIGERHTEELRGDSASLVRAILERATSPVTQPELLEHLATVAGAPISEAQALVIEEAIARLIALGALQEAAGPSPALRSPNPGSRVVLAVSGAISAVHAPELAGMLLARGHTLRVAATENALRFFAPAAMEAITHQPIYSSLFQRDAACPVPHINLAEWAEAVLVCPASASTIARIAHGDCSDLVSAIAISTRKPVVIAPSMNPAMLAAPAVARNLEQLREDGFYVVHSSFGEEVAHAPQTRVPILGPQPPIADIVRILDAVLAGAGPRALEADEWDRIYATGTEPPWSANGLDGALLRALSAHGIERGRVLDVGTGTGTVAIELAKRGFEVTAIDVAPSALAQARARDGAGAVSFLESDLFGYSCPKDQFDVVHDRGCFHGLNPLRRAEYVAAVARMVRPQGWLVLQALSGPNADIQGVFPIARAEIEALFAGTFELVAGAETTLIRGAPAMLYVLARTSHDRNERA